LWREEGYEELENTREIMKNANGNNNDTI